MLLSLEQIATFTGAEIIGDPRNASRIACGISWDSREVEAGFVYVALPGERVDGHSFVVPSFEAGAVAALISRDPDETMLRSAHNHNALLLQVPDTHQAFTDLAKGWRGCLTARVIGLTGSTGKTTTKNLVRDVLSSTYKTVATKANQNNELGVPRTLLNANPDTEMVVVEMGMRGAGQIAHLCTFVKPDWGVITNIGESHIELLGSRDNIARAKAELIAGIPDSGVAFLNGADDKTDFVWQSAEGSRRGVVPVCYDGSGNYGLQDAGCQVAVDAQRAVWAEDITLDEEGYPTFMLCCKGFLEQVEEQVQVTLALRGLHNVSNACAAAAVGRMANIPLVRIAEALQSSKPESARLEVTRAPGGYTVINDAYNANPDSMRASLNLFAALEVPGKRFAVLGDMGELGSFAPAMHEEVGAYAAASSLDWLVCVGELAVHIAQGAKQAGFPEDKIVQMRTKEDALAFVKEHVVSGDAVLVKASHSMELDQVAKGLLN